MTAARISDDSDVPGMPLLPAQGPRIRWRIGVYEFERYARSQSGPGSRGRWGCTWRNQRGAGNCHSPVAAFLAVRRSLREYPN